MFDSLYGVVDEAQFSESERLFIVQKMKPDVRIVDLSGHAVQRSLNDLRMIKGDFILSDTDTVVRSSLKRRLFQIRHQFESILHSHHIKEHSFPVTDALSETQRTVRDHGNIGNGDDPHSRIPVDF